MQDGPAIMGLSVIGMLLLARVRGGLDEKHAYPIFQLIRNYQGGTDEQIVELITLQQKMAYELPVQALPQVVAELSSNLSPNARSEILVTLMAYSMIGGDSGVNLAGPELSPSHEINKKLILIFQQGLNIPDSAMAAIGAAAKERFGGSQSPGNPERDGAAAEAQANPHPESSLLPMLSDRQDGPVTRTELPESAELRRNLLGVIVANIALDSKLKSSNRAHELGDPTARRNELAKTVLKIMQRHGTSASSGMANQMIDLSAQYLSAYLDATLWVIDNLQNSATRLKDAKDLADIQSMISISKRLNDQLPAHFRKLTDADVEAIEAGMAQAEREAQK